jgi:hypothetical protein
MTAAGNIEAINAVQTVMAAEQSATISTAISGRPSRTCLSMARTIVKRIVGWLDTRPGRRRRSAVCSPGGAIKIRSASTSVTLAAISARSACSPRRWLSNISWMSQCRQADFIAHKDWMGGRVYGNTFAPRSRILEYTPDFETRLTEAKKITPGPGLLVFCGNGVRWHRSNLEDFADFYHAAKHRQDDPFALMEDDHIKKEKLQIARNVDIEQAAETCFVWPVRGPSIGGVVKS